MMQKMYFLNMDQAVPCGLIINEILTNIFKYAFVGEKTGLVLVNLQETEELIELVIKDNGIGYDESKVNKNTLGIRLIKSLTKQLKGSYSMLNEKGTKCTLTFNKKYLDA